jgi:hypothetical protein
MRILTDRLEGVLPPAGGIVDQDLYGSERGFRPIEEPDRGARIPKVSLNGLSRTTSIKNRRHHAVSAAGSMRPIRGLSMRRIVDAQVAQEHRGAARRQQSGSSGANAMIGARNERNSPREIVR